MINRSIKKEAFNEQNDRRSIRVCEEQSPVEVLEDPVSGSWTSPSEGHKLLDVLEDRCLMSEVRG